MVAKISLERLVPIPAHAWRYLRCDVRTAVAKGAGKKFFELCIARGDQLSADSYASVDRSQQDIEMYSGFHDVRAANEEEFAETKRPYPPCHEPLQIVVDEGRKLVTVMGFGDLTGRNHDLILPLWRKAKLEHREGRLPENQQSISPDELATMLDVQEPTIRRRVTDCRSKFGEMYLAKCGREPSQDLLIETRHGRGYRLNPWVRFVAPTELQ